MRANSIYDRDGNSYRYARQEHRQKELVEREAQSRKWDDLYQKAGVLAKKDDQTTNVNRSS